MQHTTLVWIVHVGVVVVDDVEAFKLDHLGDSGIRDLAAAAHIEGDELVKLGDGQQPSVREAQATAQGQGAELRLVGHVLEAAVGDL